MPLHLVTGRASAGKTERIIQALRDAALSGRQAVLLLPRRTRVASLRDSLVKQAAVGVEVTTFSAWVESQWALFGDGRRLVTPTVRDAAVAQALAASPKFADLASKRGTVRLVARLAQTLADCQQALERGQGLAPALVEYARIVAEAGFVETGEAARLLSSAMRLEGVCLCCLGFPQLLPAHEQLLRAMSEANDVWIGVTWEDGFPATEAARPLVSRLAPTADHITLTSRAPTTELAALEARLFSSDCGPPLKFTGDVRFAISSGDEAETSLIAMLVRGLLDEGFAEDEIAIAFPRLRGQDERLLRELASDGIEAVVEARMPLQTEPFGRALLALLDIARGAGGREEMLAFLLSPYSDAEPDAVQELDLLWRRKRTADAASLLAGAARQGARTASAIVAARQVVRSPATEAAGEVWKKLADALLASAASAGDLGSPSFLADAAAHRATLRAVDEAIASAEPLGAPYFIEGLRSGDVVVGRAQGRGVRVTTVDELAGRRFDVVLLAGLNADQWAPGEGTSALGELLRRAGVASADELVLERQTFYSAATSARRRLVLCRQVADSSGVARRAAAAWEDVLALYREADGDPDADFPPDAPVERLWLTDLAEAAPAGNKGQRGRREELRDSLRRVRGRLTDDLALASLADRSQFSVTELEAYLSCPYRWFYQYAVRPREVDRELGAREVGAYAHELLASFYGKLREQGHVRVTRDLSPGLDALVDAVVAEAVSSGRVRPQSLAEELALANAHEQVRALIRDDIDFLPGWQPLPGEQPFGVMDAPALEFAGALLVGRIDRVDLGDGCAAVTDYKSGGGQPGQGSFATRGRLQPVVYAVAAGRSLGLQPAAGLYRSLRSLDLRGFWRTDLMCPPSHSKSNDGIDEERWKALLEETEMAVEKAVEGIRAGDIAPRPARRDSCMFCSAADGCRGPLR